VDGRSSLQAEEVPEIAFLGNGQALSLSGLQFPNPRVLSLLGDGDLLKKMFLFFDGLMVFGVGLSSRDGRGLSLQPKRPLHLLPDGNHLFAEISHPVDEITIQLIEMGLLSCVDPRGLIPNTNVEAMLAALIDFAVKAPSESTTEQEMVPFDPGALGIMMSEELVRWAVDELCGSGQANIRKAEGLVTLEERGGKKASIGTELVFVHRNVSEAFAVVSDQVVRAVAWESKIVCSPLRASMADQEALSWRVADLAVLESEIAGVDLSKVSLGDIIGFAKENRRLRRSYVRTLRQRAAFLEQLEPQEAAVAGRELQEEIREAGKDFSRYARDYFGAGPVGVALGIAGSVGNLLVGNLPGAAISLGQSLNSARVQDAGPSAYSYLFQARRRLW
jgi:hypothetical protein